MWSKRNEGCQWTLRSGKQKKEWYNAAILIIDANHHPR